MKYVIFILAIWCWSCEEALLENAKPALKINGTTIEQLADSIKLSKQDSIVFSVEIEDDAQVKYKPKIKVAGLLNFDLLIDGKEYINVMEINKGVREFKFKPRHKKISDDVFYTDEILITLTDVSGEEVSSQLSLTYFKNLSPVVDIKTQTEVNAPTQIKYYKLDFKNVYDKDEKYGGDILRYNIQINQQVIELSKEEAEKIHFEIYNAFASSDSKINIEFYAYDNENKYTRRTLVVE